jgi:hypothetical protein
VGINRTGGPPRHVKWSTHRATRVKMDGIIVWSHRQAKRAVGRRAVRSEGTAPNHINIFIAKEIFTIAKKHYTLMYIRHVDAANIQTFVPSCYKSSQSTGREVLHSCFLHCVLVLIRPQDVKYCTTVPCTACWYSSVHGTRSTAQLSLALRVGPHPSTGREVLHNCFLHSVLVLKYFSR